MCCHAQVKVQPQTQEDEGTNNKDEGTGIKDEGEGTVCDEVRS